jgi:hypothetical protein
LSALTSVFAKRAFKIGTMTGIPGGVDQRFVREDGVGDRGARQEQRADDEKKDATAPPW